ncbi:MAG: hypothetical protein K0Q48_1682 [Bacillota bacterium]|nr:hypothetical protein [Bacillota bacterium]
MNRFKQKTGRRVLSFVLVLALLIPMIPAPVFADAASDYAAKVSEINEYRRQAAELLNLTDLPEGAIYQTKTEFQDAINDYLQKIDTDLMVAASLLNKDLNKDLASSWKDTSLKTLQNNYKKLSEADRQKNALNFFNHGGFTTGISILGYGYEIVYKSKFHDGYSGGILGQWDNTKDVSLVMRDTLEALKLGCPYLTPEDRAKHEYEVSLAKLRSAKDGIVSQLLSENNDLDQLITDLNKIVGSLDDIMSTLDTLEKLGIGQEVLDPILKQAGLNYDTLIQLEQLRNLLDAAGIKVNPETGQYDIGGSLDEIGGKAASFVINGIIVAVEFNIQFGGYSEEAYIKGKADLDAAYTRLITDANTELRKTLEPIMKIVVPLRPYLGMMDSSISLVENMAVLVEQVDALQDDFTAGGLSVATYTTADTLDDLADFLVAFDAAGLGGKLSGLLENSNLGGSVADGTAAMLNQLIKELIKQDVELSGSDLGIIQRTVDSLAKAGLDDPTALVPMLRASVDVLRRAAELEGGVQDAINGNYESAWNTLTKDLGGMFSKTVTLWNSIVALFEKPEVQEFAALTMDRQTGELNLDSLGQDEFLQSFGEGINAEAQATFKVLIDPKCSDSEKLARFYKFYYFLKDVKTFMSDLEDASNRLNEACKWAEENLTKEEAKAFIENMARHYAVELRACIKDGLNSSSIKQICREIEDSVSEMRDLLNYIKCTGELEIIATPGEDDVYYTFSTNYDSLRDRLGDVLRTLGISTGYKVNSPAEQFTVEGNKLIAIGDLGEGHYEVKVAYQMYFAVCDRDFASTLATKWVTVNISGAEPEPKLTGIEITAPPSRRSYIVGEGLDLAGMEVTAYYSDETAKILDLSKCDIEPKGGAIFDSEGERTVTVSYGGYSDSFIITVTDNEADIYQVRFDTNGGVLLDEGKESLPVKDGTEISLPRAARTNHTFNGWFDEERALAGMGGDIYTVRRDVTLTAFWTEIVTKKEFTVTFDPNGGIFSEGVPSSVTKEEGLTISLPAITRSGYTFNGWYNADSFGGNAGEAFIVNKDITLVARWTINGSGGGNGGGGNGGGTRQILDETVPLGGIYSLMSLPAEPKDGIVYYVNAAGEIVFVPFCFTIGDKIYFLGQVGIKYQVKANSKQFEDIAGNWAYDNILAIASREAFQGYPDSSFQPGSPMTRAMLSAVLARMAMVDTNSYKTRVFDDVSPEAWYGPSVAWAYEQGIVTGVGGKQFNPNANITRQEFSVMLTRFISYMSISLQSETVTPFADEDLASDWAKTAIAEMKKYNIVTGRSGNLFDPYSDITRAEITTMLYRLIQSSITYGYENSLKETKKAN